MRSPFKGGTLPRGAAVYFASDEAAWVSGAVLLVSGGSVMTSDPYRYLMRVNKG